MSTESRSKPTNGELRPAVPARQTFVQTDREAHVQWGRLAVKRPMAAAVMHQLVALMDRKSAVAISHATLATLVGIHQTTVKQALKYLRENNWLQQVQLGKRGTVNVYVVNSRVAWADYRDNLNLAAFDARIVADAQDQDASTLAVADLRKIPIIHPPEEALPEGEWPAGETGYLDGLEPVARGLPATADDAPPRHRELKKIE